MGLFTLAVLPLAIAKSKPSHHKQLQKNGGSPKSKDFINKQKDKIRNQQKENQKNTTFIAKQPK